MIHTDAPRPEDDDLLRRLLAYDEALAAGIPADEARRSSSANDGSVANLQAYLGLLDKLEQCWPRASAESLSGEPFADEAMPAQVDRFRILRELGQGGFGVVYLAYDPKMRRRVALKIPRPETLFARGLRERFLREIRASAALTHPHITPVYEAGEADQVCYLISAYCAGGTLADYLHDQDEPLSIRQAALVAAQLADAIQYAHSRGVLHRDVKPGNVLIEFSSETLIDKEVPFIARLTDFGLARFLESATPESVEEESDRQDGNASFATCTGAILGTPRYMAPEQIECKATQVGPAADVYGLGALLYELLTGAPPSAGTGQTETLRRVLTEDPLPPRRFRPGIPRDLEAICLKCLEKRPDRRFSSAEELSADLHRFLRGDATQARPLSLAQRAVRWAQRHPARSGLAATAAVSLLGLLIGVYLLGSYASALRSALHRESKQLLESNRHRRIAERHEQAAREQAYVGDIWRSWRLLAEGGGSRVSELLSHSRPSPAQKDLRGFEWRYLWRLGGNLVELRDHHANLEGFCFSHDGRTIASWSGYQDSDRAIRLWDVSTRSLRRTIHTDANLRSAAFHRDGQQLTSVDYKGNVCTWDIATGQKVKSRFLDELVFQPDKAYFHTIDFSHDASLLAYPTIHTTTSGAEVESVRIWDLQKDERQTPKQSVILASAPERSFHFAFDRGGSLLARSSDRGTIAVFEVATGKQLNETTRFGKSGHDVDFAPDGTALAIGCDSGLVHFWNFRSDSATSLHRDGAEDAIHMTYSADGALLASSVDTVGSGTVDRSVEIRNLDTGDKITLPVTEGICELKFSPDGAVLAMRSFSAALRLLSVEQRPEFDVTRAHAGELWDLAVSPDGAIVASASDDHKVKLWDARSMQLKATLEGHASLVAAVAFSPDGKTLASSEFNGIIKLWDVRTASELLTLVGHEGPVRAIAYHDNSRLLASVGDDRTVKLWDVMRRTVVHSFTGYTDKLRAVAFAPSGNLLLTGDNDGWLKAWDIGDKKLRWSRKEMNEVQSLILDPRGTTVAVGGKDGLIRRYEVRDGTLLGTIQVAAYGARALAFSSDGRTLASGGEDAAVTLWHVATGQELLALPGIKSQVNCLAFTPDGRSLVAGTHDGSLTVWRAEDP